MVWSVGGGVEVELWRVEVDPPSCRWMDASGEVEECRQPGQNLSGGLVKTSDQPKLRSLLNLGR